MWDSESVKGICGLVVPEDWLSGGRRWASYLLLSGLVWDFDVGEALPTAGGVSHPHHLQQTLPLHGGDEGSCRVPGRRADLDSIRGIRSMGRLFIMFWMGASWQEAEVRDIDRAASEARTSSSIFIWKSSSFSSSGAKKDFSP